MQTNMDDVHGGGAAMWWQRGNQSINQAIKKEQHQRDTSLCLSVDSFSVARWLLWNGGCTILTCSLRYD